MDENKKSEFISETIVNEEIKERRKKDLLGYAAGGAVFGLVALLIFCGGLGIWNKLHKESDVQETETVAEPVDFPTDRTELEGFVAEMIELYGNGTEENLSDKITTALEKIAPAYVSVVAETKNVGILEDEFSTSKAYSGMVFRKSDSGYYVLTSAGGFKDSDNFAVYLNDGATVPATLVKQDSNLNLAILRIDVSEGKKHDLGTVKMGKMSRISQGDAVFWYGNASGIRGSLGVGYVSCIEESIAIPDVDLTAIQVSEACNASNGSFLIGTDGTLYGIALKTENLPENYNLTSGYGVAINMEKLLRYINKMISGEKIATVGLVGQDVTEALQSTYNMPEGMVITQVEEDGPAFTAGIQKGDVLTKLGSSEIKSHIDYTMALLQLDTGKNVEATIYRESKGEYKKLTAKIKTGKR